MELADLIIDKCLDTHTNNVVFTGGNPCLYDLSQIIQTLQENFINVDLETQGSKLPYWLEDVDNLVISPKAPSSGQPDVYDKIYHWLKDSNIIITNLTIKIPIFTDEDFEFAKRYNELMKKINWETHSKIKLYLTVGNTNTEETGDISKRVLMDYEKLIDKVMKSEMSNVYVLPQVHTLVYGNKQGV